MDQRNWQRLHVHWRAWRVRHQRRRAAPPERRLAAVSPWAFWGLHR